MHMRGTRMVTAPPQGPVSKNTVVGIVKRIEAIARIARST
jgi:hypothetical protein